MTELKQMAYELTKLSQLFLERKNELSDKLREFNDTYLSKPEMNDDSFDLYNNFKVVCQLCN